MWTIAAWVLVLALSLALRQSVENKLLWGGVLSLPLFLAGLNLCSSANRTSGAVRARSPGIVGCASSRWAATAEGLS
jgi:hypothetical protein